MFRAIPIVMFLTAPFIVSAEADPPRKVLNLSPRAQQTMNWCWAATTEMIVEFLDPAQNVEQCQMAEERTGRSDCCVTSGMPSECVSTGWPRFGKHGFDAKRTNRKALSWKDVRREIDNGRPIAFSWEWRTGGTGHMMVLTGYETVNGVDVVWIVDPLLVGEGGLRRITYGEYVSSAIHSHWDDFYQIEKR